MISLLKFVGAPWEQARNGIREDLDTLEAVINNRLGGILAPGGKIRTSALPASTVTTTTVITASYNAGAQVAMCRFCGGAW